MLGAHVLEGILNLLAALRAQRRSLGIGVDAGELRQVWHLIAAVLQLLPARLLLAEAQAGVHRDPVKPGGEGALSPEVPYVLPDPDPDLLARILGVVFSKYAKSHSIYKTRVIPNEFREGLDVAPGGCADEISVLVSQRMTPFARRSEVSSRRGPNTKGTIAEPRVLR